LPGRSTRIICAAAALVAHALAALFYYWLNHVWLPPHWTPQFLFLLSVSCIFSILAAFLARLGPIWVLLVARYAIVLIIGLPMGVNLSVEASLIVYLILEAYTYTTMIGGFVYGSAVIIASLLAQRQLAIWYGVVIPVPAFQDRVAFTALAFLILALGAYCRYLMDTRITHREFEEFLNQTTMQLAQANMELQEYAVRAESMVSASLRTHLAREIHDALANALSNLLMLLEEAFDVVDRGNEEAVSRLTLAHSQAKQASSDLRRTLKELRENETEPVGMEAIEKLLEVFSEVTRIQTKLVIYRDAPLLLGGNADLAAYRLVQESLTNALRHGHATAVSITIAKADDGVTVAINDNGIGVGQIKQGYGLLGMSERIEKLGGYVRVSSEPGVGFFIFAWIPMDGEDSDDAQEN